MTGEDTAGLLDLLHGKFAGWHGVPAEADEAWVRAALGESVQRSGDSLLQWRGGATGPEGALIWLSNGAVEGIEMPHPRIPPEATDSLDEPELVLPTPWSRVGQQRAWPSRGLAVHVNFDMTVRVTGLPIMTAKAYAASKWASAGRAPRR